MARRVRPPTGTDLPASRRARDTLHVLGGGPSSESVCYFCFCDPCLSNPDHLPDFIRGSTSADPSNVARRYRVYRKLWSFLRCLGLWDFPPYLQRKEATGHSRSPRDIIPWCIKQVCPWAAIFPPHILLSSYASWLIQEIRRRFPNPPELPYADHKWSADV